MLQKDACICILTYEVFTPHLSPELTPPQFKHQSVGHFSATFIVEVFSEVALNVKHL